MPQNFIINEVNSNEFTNESKASTSSFKRQSNEEVLNAY